MEGSKRWSGVVKGSRRWSGVVGGSMKSPVFTISGRDPSDRSRVKPHQGGQPL